MTVSATSVRSDLTTDHRLVQVGIGMITVVAVAVVAAQHWSDPAAALGLAAVVMTYGRLSIIDLAEQRLPNRITLPLAGATLLVIFAAGVGGGQTAGAVTAIGVGLVFAILLAVLRFGMGDVKLALTVGMIAGWFGRDALLATIYTAATAGAIVALILMVVHRRRELTFGFGPCLALGSVAGMLAAG